MSVFILVIISKKFSRPVFHSVVGGDGVGVGGVTVTFCGRVFVWVLDGTEASI